MQPVGPGFSPNASDDEEVAVHGAKQHESLGRGVVQETSLGAPPLPDGPTAARSFPAAAPRRISVSAATPSIPEASETDAYAVSGTPEPETAAHHPSVAELQAELALDGGSDSETISHPPSLRGPATNGDAFARTSAQSLVRPSTSGSMAGEGSLSALHRAARAGNQERLARLLALGEVECPGFQLCYYFYYYSLGIC